MPAKRDFFRCMACGNEYEEEVKEGKDEERSCPKCRSKSIRHLKKHQAVKR